MNEEELARLVEFSEARAYLSFMSAAPADLASRHGFRATRVGSTVLLMAESVTTSLVLNRAIGLGVLEPASEETLDQIRSAYASAGVPFAIELSPASKPELLPDWLRARRMRRVLSSRILYRDGAPPRPIYRSWAKSTGLRVEKTGKAHAAALATLTCQNFRMPDPVGALIAGTASRPGWRQWLAFDGDEPVGGSLSHVEDGICWLGWTSVLPSHRGRWVHAGIVAKQIEDACEAGCRWLTTETASGTKENPDPAYFNLKNFSFQDAYMRPSYVGRP